jgi:SAM-dependent methyltransferase
MSPEIISLAQWLTTAPGRFMLQWERQQFEEALSDVFGFHALQLGLPQLPALDSNRMPHQWLALGGDLVGLADGDTPLTGAPVTPRSNPASLMLHSAALPFAENALDLVVLPHTLELSDDPHATLREVERVLMPEGRVVISGLNPASLWGLRQRRGRWMARWGLGQLFLPEQGDFIGYWRLRDWLRLLGFEVESARFGVYRPALSHARWLDRFSWLDQAGARWWPIFGAVYFVVAVKRVRGMRLIEPTRREAGRRRTVAVAVRRQGRVSAQDATCDNL